MSTDKLLESLHPLERKVLPVLKQYSKIRDIEKKTRLKDVEIVRALQWLENKKIVTLKKELREFVSLDHNGKVYLKIGLPEKRFLKSLEDDKLTLIEIKEKANLTYEEINVCLGLLKKKEAIKLLPGMRIMLTDYGRKIRDKEFLEEKFIKKLPLEIKKLSAEEKHALTELKRRKAIVKLELVKDISASLTTLGKNLLRRKMPKETLEVLTPAMLKSGKWKGKEFRRYDVKINVPRIYPVKRHMISQAIDYVKKIWLELGFKEMKGNLLDTSFWNFDALFTAQDHPARDLQDTFYIKDPEKGKLPAGQIVDRVKKTHENGWTTGSTGWQYSWSTEEAKKNVLRTHTTILSAKTLASLKSNDIPGKFFSVGKCFRNETVDWNHLFELIQVEGIVVDENVNFRNLIGYLKEFFGKMGFEKVRVRPGYFPYTSVSAEVDVYHPIKKKWMELGGSGIFRPEVVKPLLGKDIPVLAWGLGLERTIMDYYDMKDIRDLYKNDLKQLREVKQWLM